MGAIGLAALSLLDRISLRASFLPETVGGGETCGRQTGEGPASHHRSGTNLSPISQEEPATLSRCADSGGELSASGNAVRYRLDESSRRSFAQGKHGQRPTSG